MRGGKEGTSYTCHLGRAMESGVHDPHKTVSGTGGKWASLLQGLEGISSGARLPGFKSRPHHLVAMGHLNFVTGSSSVK